MLKVPPREPVFKFLPPEDRKGRCRQLLAASGAGAGFSWCCCCRCFRGLLALSCEQKVPTPMFLILPRHPYPSTCWEARFSHYVYYSEKKMLRNWEALGRIIVYTYWHTWRLPVKELRDPNHRQPTFLYNARGAHSFKEVLLLSSRQASWTSLRGMLHL